MTHIHLSAPHVGAVEEQYVRETFASKWISTMGPNVEAFEAAFSKHLGRPSLAVASGTAAIHLGLRLLGVGAGDDVLVSDLTFVASVNPIRYLGGNPLFIDSDRETWMMDPALLAEALEDRARRHRIPRAVVVVHLFGQSADMDPILDVCRKYDVPILEDAAEALGALYKGKPVGTSGDVSAFSFNGNKIITTAGGGMLSSREASWIEKARFWSTQARDRSDCYEHSELGYNYRLSNVLAGIGRGQLQLLDDRVERRRAIAFRYQAAFDELPGIQLMPQAPYGRHTNWLSCFLLEPDEFGATRDEVIRALAEADVEARPLWKPMHLQPLYKDCECYGGGAAAELFAKGICLPSSSNLAIEEQQRVIDVVRSVARGEAGLRGRLMEQHGT